MKVNIWSGGGQVVSVLAFHSDDPSSNPTEVYSFEFCELFEKNENKQKEAGDGTFKITEHAIENVNLFSPLPKFTFISNKVRPAIRHRNNILSLLWSSCRSK